MRQPGVLRKKVLVPGHILEQCGEKDCPGKHHGSVVKVEKREGGGYAYVQMTDIKKRIRLPLSEVHRYIISDDSSSTIQMKRSRDDSEYSRWKQPVAPPSMPVSGTKLQEFICRINQECHSLEMKPGTRVWVNLGTSNGRWPAIVWALQYCRKDDLSDVLLTYKPGRYLVNFYGEHSLMWIKEKQMLLAVEKIDSDSNDALEAWGKKHKKTNLVKLAIMETLNVEDQNSMEIQRVISLYNMHTLVNKRQKSICHVCSAPNAPLKCTGCDRRFHTLCLSPPTLTIKYLPDKQWKCPCCDTSHSYGNNEASKEESAHEHADKMGLTPDWIISAAAFDVFGLERPTASRPFIQKLLDPCTNSKVAPNIPAEKLYDKNDNGLKLTNLWKGYYVVLNPDFSSQVQWRFVNRAIDEVENGSVPAVILICRNSTDTAFYQRLRPYPRVNLRRLSVLFKDYSNTPIGFGVSIFCLAKVEKRILYPKFYSAFAAQGEPSIPVDDVFIDKSEFWDLLDRLGDFTGSHHRDHWVKCSICAKWRIISWDAIQNLGSNTKWDCSLLNPPHSSCMTPLTKMESVGGHYVVKDEEDDFDPEFRIFDSQPQETCLGDKHAISEDQRRAIKGNLDAIITELKGNEINVLPRERTMESGNIDLRSLTALELARKARMAANKAYLSELGTKSEELNNKNDQGNFVSDVAREIASHVAKTTCFSEIERARLDYQKVVLTLSKEEEKLRRELAKIENTKLQAKNNLDAAIEAASIIEKEIQQS